MKIEQRHPLFGSALESLRRAGVEARLETEQNRWRLIVRGGERDEHEFELDAVHVTKATDPVLLAVPAELSGTTLVTRMWPPAVAEELRRHRINYVDAAGNASLIDGGLHVFITGRRGSAREMTRTTVSRAYRPAGLRLIFAILSRPELLNASYRDMAAAGAVSLGSVSVILESLSRLGFLAEVRRGRRLTNPEALVNEWARAWAGTMLDRDVLGRFSAPDPRWWKKAIDDPADTLWGGEAAAFILLHDVIPERISLYSSALPSALLARFRLRKDEAGPVIVRLRTWRFEHELERSDHVVPPPLIYAELLANGDGRSLEAARAIHDRFILRSLQRF